MLIICLNVLIAYTVDSSNAEESWDSWRVSAIVMTIPLVASLPFIPWLPESPRWLLANGRPDDAKDILNTVCRVNGTPGFPGHLSAPPAKDSSSTPSMLVLFSNRKVNGGTVRKLTVLNMCAWFACTAGYYGLGMFVSSMPGSIYINNLISTLIE